jgi:hypothetical protein
LGNTGRGNGGTEGCHLGSRRGSDRRGAHPWPCAPRRRRSTRRAPGSAGTRASGPRSRPAAAAHGFDSGSPLPSGSGSAPARSGSTARARARRAACDPGRRAGSGRGKLRAQGRRRGHGEPPRPQGAWWRGGQRLPQAEEAGADAPRLPRQAAGEGQPAPDTEVRDRRREGALGSRGGTPAGSQRSALQGRAKAGASAPRPREPNLGLPAHGHGHVGALLRGFR